MILNDVMIDVDDRGRLVLENEAVKISEDSVCKSYKFNSLK